ncbi:MAG: DUF1800 domain-containing protein [Acidobacteriia bacterium]|nr:DUF1800 domain-containing protein [Terriglobia bacterium]
MNSLLRLLVLAGLVLDPFMPLLQSVAASETALSSNTLSGNEQIIHVLNRLTYGIRPGDVERVQETGLKNFIEQQLHPESIADSQVAQKLSGLDTLSMGSLELAAIFPPPNVIKQIQQAMAATEDKMAGEAGQEPAGSPGALKKAQQRRLEIMEALAAQNPDMQFRNPQEVIRQLQQSEVLRAVYSERQLDEEMVNFWENHFNIFAGKGADRWLLTEYDRDVIRPNALGKFKDLVEATAHSPAMMFYLDNWLSVDPNARLDNPHPRNVRRFGRFGQPIPSARPQQQANLARRGLNENYARELMELHTLGVDGGYTQKDVTEVARCFTGWTIRNPRQGGDFFFNPRLHDNGTKVVLGHTIHNHGEQDGEEVINILVHHPSTAHFIAKKLVTRFVSDTPSASLVDRVAQTYLKTDGDIREMLRTIFYSPEFNSKDAYRAKVKSPFELVVSAIRTSGGDTTASPALLQLIARMGQPLFQYQAPTGYPDRADEWLNSGTLLTRLNFAMALAANKIPGTNVDLLNLLKGIDPSQAEAVRTQLVRVYLNGQLSDTTRAALNKDAGKLEATNTQMIPPDTPQDTQTRALPVEVAGLIMGSPEFQRR